MKTLNWSKLKHYKEKPMDLISDYLQAGSFRKMEDIHGIGRDTLQDIVVKHGLSAWIKQSKVRRNTICLSDDGYPKVSAKFFHRYALWRGEINDPIGSGLCPMFVHICIYEMCILGCRYQNGNEYEIHHIDEDKLNFRSDNLIALNRSLHRQLHRDPSKFDSIKNDYEEEIISNLRIMNMKPLDRVTCTWEHVWENGLKELVCKSLDLNDRKLLNKLSPNDFPLAQRKAA